MKQQTAQQTGQLTVSKRTNYRPFITAFYNVSLTSHGLTKSPIALCCSKLVSCACIFYHVGSTMIAGTCEPNEEQLLTQGCYIASCKNINKYDIKLTGINSDSWKLLANDCNDWYHTVQEVVKCNQQQDDRKQCRKQRQQTQAFILYTLPFTILEKEVADGDWITEPFQLNTFSTINVIPWPCKKDAYLLLLSAWIEILKH